jgi:hypothetical protein
MNAQNPKSQSFGEPIRNPDAVIDELISKVEFLLNLFNLWSEDGHFTFPDGDRWDCSHQTILEVDGNPSSLTVRIERALLSRHPVTLPRERARNYAELAAWVVQGGQ